MFAGFQTSKSRPLVAAALEGRVLRQQIISSNIANIDTPYYKSKDVDFESALIAKKNEIYGQNGDYGVFKMATTDPKHFGNIDFPASNLPTIYLRDGHTARNDANTVDLDVETTELSKNAIMVQAIDYASKKQGEIFKSVIDSSSKI